MSNSPCQGCAKRAVGCHGQCEAYQAFAAENRRRNAERLKTQIPPITERENRARQYRANGRTREAFYGPAR